MIYCLLCSVWEESRQQMMRNGSIFGGDLGGERGSEVRCLFSAALGADTLNSVRG